MGAFGVQRQYSSDIFFLWFVCFLTLSVYSWICEQPLLSLSISSISGQSSRHVGQVAKGDLYLLLVLLFTALWAFCSEKQNSYSDVL